MEGSRHVPGADGTPGFAYDRQPRTILKLLHEVVESANASPTSVIAEVRSISPASSSSSSSIDRRRRTHLSKANPQPRHDRGYSISDGEFSDPDTTLAVDSTGATARELAVTKVGNSTGPALESLPETHSLALEAVTRSFSSHHVSGALEDRNSKARTRSCSGEDHPAGDSNCRSKINPSSCSNTDDKAMSALDIARSPSCDGAHTSRLGVHSTATLVSSACEDRNHHQILHGEWSQTATTSCECSAASELDETLESSSPESTQNHSTGSESEDESTELSSRRKALLSPDSLTLDSAAKIRRSAAVHGSMGSVMDHPATPLRLFPGRQAQLGSPPAGGHLSAGFSPGSAEKAGQLQGSYSPGQGLSDMGRGLGHFQHRSGLSGPLLGGSMVSKPPPSKWDDAEKWIVSPGHHESALAQLQHRSGQTLFTGRRHSVEGQAGLRSYHEMGSPEYSTRPHGGKPTLSSTSNFENSTCRSTASHKKRSKTLSFGDLSRRFDLSRSAGSKPLASPDELFNLRAGKYERAAGAALETVPTSAASTARRQTSRSERGREVDDERPEHSPGSIALSRETRKPEMHSKYDSSKSATSPVSATETSLDEPTKHVQILPKHNARSEAMKETAGTNPPQPPDPPTLQAPESTQSSHTPAQTAVSVDGNHKNHNPTCTRTPELFSTTSPTRHNTPARGSSGNGRWAAPAAALQLPESDQFESCDHPKLELRKLDDNTLDSHLMPASWGTREEEDLVSCASLRQHIADLGEEGRDDSGDSPAADPATAWEAAEQAKSIARYNREEAEIKAWEELQNAKAKAEMKKIEVKLEKMRTNANEKMNKRIDVATRKAKELRVAAEAIRTEQAAKTAQRAEQMRTTGHLSPSVRCYRLWSTQI